jgi:hypothetical protein
MDLLEELLVITLFLQLGLYVEQAIFLPFLVRLYRLHALTWIVKKIEGQMDSEERFRL